MRLILRSIAAHGLWLLTVFSLIYIPDLGHGFVKDDFAWIAHSRIQGRDSLYSVLFEADGFYRPLVSVTFSLNEALFGLCSFPYGLTNFLLAIACAVATFFLMTSLRLSPGPSLAGAAVWAFNFHAVNMAILWLSGRTALLLTLFTELTVLAVIRQWHAAFVFILSLAAMCSKEEAILLPLLCAAAAFATNVSQDRETAFRTAVRASLPAVAAVAAYAALRTNSGAYTPLDAPPHYALQAHIGTLGRNLAEYADRSLTVGLAVLAVFLGYLRVVPRLGRERVCLLMFAGTWWAISFAITIFLPVRSSLYALWPSVATAIAVAVIIDAVVAHAPVRKLRSAALVGLVIPLLLVPVYWSRNVRWVELADLTAKTLQTLNTHSGSVPENSVIVLHDDDSTRANLANAFGSLYPQAAELFFGGRHGLLIPSIDASTQEPEHVGAVFELRDGQINRLK